MPSVQRILANHNNALPGAALVASSVAAAVRQVFRQPTTRAGNGQVVLSGGYTGANDATIDVEILSASGTAARVSQPVFAGAGNGTMTQPTAADGTASQGLTVTLTDLGTVTTYSTLTLYGEIYLQAQTAGSDGNDLVLTVTPDLALGDVVGALSVDLKADTQEWTDASGNFGAIPLNADGTLPSTCPRLVFGGNTSQVYRHYKRWDGTQWQYGVSPKLASDFAKGSTISPVTGTYSVTLTDGVTPETYSSITTLYDLLLALNASDLVRAVGVVANDRKVNGINAVDLPIRTSAFALPVILSTPDKMPELQNLTVAAEAPTETVTLTCTANTPIGGEIWSVASPTAPGLPDAKTGVLYDSYAAVQFEIPVVPMDTHPITGTFAITATSFANAETEKGSPAVCLYRPALGANAANQTLKLVWTARPAGDCDCASASVSGGPDPACLGVDVEGGADVSGIPEWYRTRLVSLYQWQQTFVADNTALDAATGLVTTIANDVALAKAVVTTFADALATIYGNCKLDTPPTVISDALEQWDDELTAVQDDLADLAAINTAGSYTAWAANTEYSVGDEVVPTSQRATGHWYKLALIESVSVNSDGDHLDHPSANSGSIEPAWPTDGGTVAEAGAVVVAMTGFNTRTDYTMHWQDMGAIGGADIVTTADPAAYRHTADQFAQRYEAAMATVLAMAGIVPKSDAGGEGSACWQDPGTDHYWRIEGTNYLPVFSNVYYHSVVEQYSPDSGKTEIVSTHEFGFGLRVACEERLSDGDSVTITIGDVSSNYPYAVGDTYKIPLIAGGPLNFAGGIDGTDTQTWTVQSSTDGLLADYSLTATEDPYSDGGLGFTINRGGIPFALGDAFTFSVESGGRFKWRKDSGSWSSATAIADSVSLTDGLSAAFVSGAAPSFVESDLHSFTVRQPHSPAHVQSAHGETWQWTGATATLTATWTTDQTISAVGVLRHGLSGAATVSIALKNSGGTTLHTFAPTVAAGPLLEFLASPLAAVRSLVVTIAGATGQALGWLYAGAPLATTHNASRCKLQRAYRLEAGSGINPRGLYLGAGRGGEIAWEDFLTQTDLDALLALVDACKADDDAPVVVVPQALSPQDAALVRINADALEVSDWFEFQPDDRTRRALSLTLPLDAVIA